MSEHADKLSTLELANSLFQEYYAQCFWHLKPDLIVTKETLPIIIKGLRAHGGKRGWLLAADLADRAEK